MRVRDVDLASIVSSVVARGAQRVACQFPDSWLQAAPSIVAELQRRARDDGRAAASDSPPVFYLMADTTFSPCCVDEVAAKHVDAELVVHFGDACLSPTQSLPVLYVFERAPLDVERLLERVGAEAARAPDRQQQQQQRRARCRTRLVLAPEYSHAAAAVEQMTGDGVCSDGGGDAVRVVVRCQSGVVVEAGEDRRHDVFAEIGAAAEQRDELVCYVSRGDDDGGAHMRGIPSRSALELALQHAHRWCRRQSSASFPAASGGDDDDDGAHRAPLHVFNPERDRLSPVEVGAFLRRRYAVASKLLAGARPAADRVRVVGIVSGTLGVAGHTDIIDRCKRLLGAARLKCYVFCVGKVTPAKLANFPEIDAFVLVSDARNAVLAGERNDYWKPVLTPYELYAAVMAQLHSGLEPGAAAEEYHADAEAALAAACCDPRRYTLDFCDVLRMPMPTTSREEEDEAAVYAVQRGNGGSDTRALDGHALAKRGPSALLRNDMVSGDGDQPHHFAALSLQRREWRGLQPRVGETAPTRAVQGARGIASGYEGESERARVHSPR